MNARSARSGNARCLLYPRKGCRTLTAKARLHSVTVYVPGLTDRTGSKERAGISAEADAAGYNKRQTQRYMERTVRKWKRRQAAAITPEDERMARAYVVKWQGKLRELTGGTTLPRKYDREGGRVVLSEQAKKLKPYNVS